MLTRRVLLASALEAGVLAAARASAQSRVSRLPRLFDIEKVADGVYAAIAKPAALINSNAAIFEGAADIVIVDSHSKPSAAASLASQIRAEITSKPIRAIVNTHFHWDHTQGTPFLKRVAPHADVVASDTTRRLLEANGASRLKESVEQARAALDGHKQKLAAAKTPAEKDYWQRMIVETNEYIGEMRDYAPELPNVTLKTDLTLHDKAHDLHFAFRGRGHTAGDIVVFCPQKKTVATGDLLHGFAPYIGDGYPLEWPRTLLHLAEFPFEHVVGGHAGVERGRVRLYQMGTYIEEITEMTARSKRAGKPLEAVRQEWTPARLKSLAEGYGEFLIDSSLRYRMLPPGADRARLLAEMVAGNLAHVYTRVQ